MLNARITYKIHLEPEDGLTLEARTKDEWTLGYLFRVIWCDTPMFRTGSRVTSDDLAAQEEHHPVRFIPSVSTLSVVDKLRREADNDYYAATIVDTMVDEHDNIILKRGQ